MTPVARRAGDRGWLLELPPDLAPAHVAAGLRDALGGRLQDVVPGHCTVLVVGDARVQELLDAVEAGAAAAPVEVGEIAIPVAYDGPDLVEVAELTGFSQEEVARRHAGATYTAAFLGFAPGWAYLSGLDERLVVPRRLEPRERVPAGSVAIAGPYSGVYPRVTPGGWRLIGRTDVVLFDPGRARPSLITPGDRVRFVPL
jgi:KipI family sensor histidine kinase inhibitor